MGQLEGREEGERAALALVVTTLARLRLCEVPAEKIARIDATTKADLEHWLERFVTAKTLDHLFA